VGPLASRPPSSKDGPAFAHVFWKVFEAGCFFTLPLRKLAATLAATPRGDACSPSKPALEPRARGISDHAPAQPT
jgi:hypothetical protein